MARMCVTIHMRALRSLCAGLFVGPERSLPSSYRCLLINSSH